MLRQTLALLDRDDGPVILEDFPEDAPGQAVDAAAAMEGMVCPVRLKRPEDTRQSEIVQQVHREMAQLAPWREAFMAASGRSIVGISGMEPGEGAAFLGEVLADGGKGLAAQAELGLRVRNVTEDLRNWYIEAAAARPGGAAAAEALADWYWGETAAGALTLALHPVAVASENPGLRAVGERALVPRAQQHRLSR